jgi:hypothetical protein
MVEGLAESARKREPGAHIEVTTIPMDGTPIDTSSKAMVRAQVPGEKISDVVFVPVQRDDPLTPTLPERLVGYHGRQSLSIVRPTAYNARMEAFHMVRTSHWPSLEAFVDASRKLPAYVWLYLPPRLAPYQAGDKWLYPQIPIMLHQGNLMVFVKPREKATHAGATTQ